MQHHFALLTRAPGAARNLGIQLGKAFRRAEIGGEERAVDVQQRNQRDVREMVPFRQHLGADQNTCAAAVHFSKVLLKRPFTAGGVAVDTRQRNAGEHWRQYLFQLFRSQPDRYQVR